MANSSLLPAGFLSTSGGNVVDQNGNIVRIQSIAISGADGPAGTVPGGMVQLDSPANIASELNRVVSEGFNTIRIPWSDVNLQSVLPTFQAIVAEASNLGLKVIFDNHDNQGHYGQQGNGLWFDNGPGSNNTDGSGNAGTITAAQFQADAVTLAQAFSGNPTVIGYDLHNEPFLNGSGATATVNWGGGGPTDIQAMYSQVGSAVEAADPGALVIAEGPQNWTGTLLNGQSGLATEGDLSAAGSTPVQLTVNGQAVNNKVMYSVHEYPSTIGGEPTDQGAGYINQMNNAWGYLEAKGIAPVWIGEMGGSLDGTSESAGAGLADQQAWASTIVPYLNGQDAAQGGPSTQTGWSWWSQGNAQGQAPDGYNNPDGSVNTGQQAVVGQLQTYNGSGAPAPTPTPNPVPTPTPVGGTASPNDTVLPAGSASMITDGSGNSWGITGGQVAENGVVDPTTKNVTELAYVNGGVWQENQNNLWWESNGKPGGWTPTDGTATSPLPTGTGTPQPPPPPTPIPTPTPNPPSPNPVAASPNDTVLPAGSASMITDGSGNSWGITGGQVAENGVIDPTTKNVTELAYVNGGVWQENQNNLWWESNGKPGGWTPTDGTATSPLPAGTSPTPMPTPSPPSPTPAPSPSPNPTPASPNDTVVPAGSASMITDGSGNSWGITGGQVAENGVIDPTTKNVTELAYVNGDVWQENQNNLWWESNGKPGGWTPTDGTATSPLPAGTSPTPMPTPTPTPTPEPIPTGSTNNLIEVSQSQISMAIGSGSTTGAGTGSNMFFITGSNDTLAFAGGVSNITDTGNNNTYILPPAGHGMDAFQTDILQSADVLNLKSVLQATDWNGAATTVANYLSVTDTATGATLWASATSGGTPVAIASIAGETHADLAAILAHATT